MERKTPLYDVHVSEGGKIVPFAGYLLPVQYPTGIIAEHEAVRTAVGMFDVSHMGEFVFSGPTALDSLNHIITNDYSAMPQDKVRYGVLCTEGGGCIDDLIVYKFADDLWLVVVNASNRLKDFAHISENILAGTHVEDISDTVAQIALQGPRAKDVLAKICDETRLPASYYSCSRHVEVAGIDCLISQTGYTGSFGYEIYTAAENGVGLWQALREAGAEFGLIPCGLGARDTLRLEASMPLYGHEMDETVSPLEAGLDLGVRLDKDEFIGREALLAQEPRRCRIGLKVTGKGIVREHQDVYAGGTCIGKTTSGTFAPYLKCAVAMALVERGKVEIGDEVEVDVRGRRVPAVVVPMPFYKRS